MPSVEGKLMFMRQNLLPVQKTPVWKFQVDVDMLKAVKSVLTNTLFTAFNISTSTLRWYTVRFTATPTQTKTSSHRD